MGGGQDLTKSVDERRQSLGAAGLLHPDPGRVAAPLFRGPSGFFLPDDKVQVKYEMLRAHAVEGLTASTAARAHGYSRAAYYLVEAAFEAGGVPGLLDERRGRKGPVKVTSETWPTSTPRVDARPPPWWPRSRTASECGSTAAPWSGPAGADVHPLPHRPTQWRGARSVSPLARTPAEDTV